MLQVELALQAVILELRPGLCRCLVLQFRLWLSHVIVDDINTYSHVSMCYFWPRQGKFYLELNALKPLGNYKGVGISRVWDRNEAKNPRLSVEYLEA